MQPITGNNPKIAKAQSCGFVAPVLTTLFILFRTENLSTYKNKKSTCRTDTHFGLTNACAIFSNVLMWVTYNANIKIKIKRQTKKNKNKFPLLKYFLLHL